MCEEEPLDAKGRVSEVGNPERSLPPCGLPGVCQEMTYKVSSCFNRIKQQVKHQDSNMAPDSNQMVGASARL